MDKSDKLKIEDPDVHFHILIESTEKSITMGLEGTRINKIYTNSEEAKEALKFLADILKGQGFKMNSLLRYGYCEGKGRLFGREINVKMGMVKSTNKLDQCPYCKAINSDNDTKELDI